MGLFIRKCIIFVLVSVSIVFCAELFSRVSASIVYGVEYLFYWEPFVATEAEDLNQMEVSGENGEIYRKGVPNMRSPAKNNTIISYNSRGFRCNEFSEEKKEGVKRIICVGDSVTLGFKVDDDKTWPSVLQNYLGSSYEVLNLAQGGYSSACILALFRAEAIKYNPDIIIICTGYGEYFERWTNIYHSDKNALWLSNLKYFLRQRLFSYFCFSRVLERGIKRVNHKERNLAAAERFKENLYKIRSLTDAEIIVAKQCMDLSSVREEKTIDGHNKIHQAIDSLGDCFIIADFSEDLLSNKSEMFYDFLHLTEKGCALFAEKTRDIILTGINR